MTILRTNLVTTTDDKRILGPTGSVLQSLSQKYIDTVQVTTTSTSYIATGLSVSFRPLSASSKLYVKISFDIVFSSGTGDGGSMLRLYRDGAAINTANNSDNFSYRSTACAMHMTGKIVHYVNATTTNPTTFQVYQRSYDGESAGMSGVWGSNTMTILEIAA
jgi:hypothetical protein